MADQLDLASAHVGENPVAAIGATDIHDPVRQIALRYAVERQTHPRLSHRDAPASDVDTLPIDERQGLSDSSWLGPLR